MAFFLAFLSFFVVAKNSENGQNPNRLKILEQKYKNIDFRFWALFGPFFLPKTGKIDQKGRKLSQSKSFDVIFGNLYLHASQQKRNSTKKDDI